MLHVGFRVVNSGGAPRLARGRRIRRTATATGRFRWRMARSSSCGSGWTTSLRQPTIWRSACPMLNDSELAVLSSNAIAAVSWSGARDCVIVSRSAWGTRPNALELDYGPRGKPRLAGGFAESDLRFNVSHCGDVALYAFARGREVGVDVEAVRELRDADAVAAGSSRARENRGLPRARPARAGRWGSSVRRTGEEAFIKALGDGLHFPLDRFRRVARAGGAGFRILRVGGCGG